MFNLLKYAIKKTMKKNVWFQELVAAKGVMQGKLIVVAYTLRTY